MLQLPQVIRGSRATFYFSMDYVGRIIGGQPRTVWFGIKGSQARQRCGYSRKREALAASRFAEPRIGQDIPGKLGVGSETVLLQPFDSHGAPENFDQFGRGVHR